MKEVLNQSVHLIKANPDKVIRSSLFANSAMMDWIVNHMGEVDYNELCLNSAAIHIIKTLPRDLIKWDNICQNSGALSLLEKNISMINWEILSGQEWALPLLTKYADARGPCLSTKNFPTHSMKISFNDWKCPLVVGYLGPIKCAPNRLISLVILVVGWYIIFMRKVSHNR